MATTPHGGIQASRLSRRLTTGDATVIGLGSMIGAGIFAALAPAAAAAQAGLVIGLAIAASVASCNAASSAQLARLYPASGGTYVYARERLSEFWAWVAGWAFVVGKLASCSAVALTFGYYLSPDYARYLAAGAVIAFVALNYFGIEKTAGATKVIVSVVLLSLMTGISRMLFAMAADHRMPSYLARVHPVHRVPHLAEVTVGVILVAVVLLADLRAAIGFSSFTVLLYYAITNISAYTLTEQERLYSRNLAVLGLLGCLALAFTLPVASVGIGSTVMLAGILVYLLQRRRGP